MKSIDSLLDDLNEVQLGKQSLSCITGGQTQSFWDVEEGKGHSCCTGSGRLSVYMHGGVNYAYLEGKPVLPSELKASDRTICGSPESC